MFSGSGWGRFCFVLILLLLLHIFLSTICFIFISIIYVYIDAHRNVRIPGLHCGDDLIERIVFLDGTFLDRIDECRIVEIPQHGDTSCRCGCCSTAVSSNDQELHNEQRLHKCECFSYSLVLFFKYIKFYLTFTILCKNHWQILKKW